MTTITSKVCLVGDFAVGKTSLAERFVNNHFSEAYLTTVGVKIDTKEFERPELGVNHKLVIWDIAGSDRFEATQVAYLRGASGFLCVADGTRSNTLRSLVYLREQLGEQFSSVPAVTLVNKNDLAGEWNATGQQIETLETQFDAVLRSSAKTGENVERGFSLLAELILDGYLRDS